jgi:hypothetical protein
LYNRRKKREKESSFVDPQSIKYEAVVKFVDTSVLLQEVCTYFCGGVL